MRNVTETTVTEAVIGKFDGCDNARLKQIITSMVKHLHAFVREIEPTDAEWFAAIKFLTDTGQKCDDRRQEFILLSDVLGISTFVELINNRKSPGMTETSVFGPFWVDGAPHLPMGATIVQDSTPSDLLVQGTVHTPEGKPIAGAVLDVWQTAPNGMYDVQDPEQPPMNLRGKFTTGADGRFTFRTCLPTEYPIPTDGPVGALLRATGRHPWRPAHLHFLITAPAFRPLITALYFEGDQYLDSDTVFGVKDSLVVAPTVIGDGGGSRIAYDFGLERAA
jgi:hydroxyquinol 1,2-dioxygenase